MIYVKDIFEVIIFFRIIFWSEINFFFYFFISFVFLVILLVFICKFYIYIILI